MNRKLAGGRGQCVALLIALILASSWFFYRRFAELTFIVLARLLEPTPSGPELTNEDIRALPMIGDVNLFFKNPREDPEFEVECEVMIAGPSLRHSSPSPHLLNEQANASPSLPEPAYRGQGRAHAALFLLLSYACDKLSVRKESFVARIGAANARSIALFASLGFEIVRTVPVFDEVEMRVVDADVARSWPAGQVREYS